MSDSEHYILWLGLKHYLGYEMFKLYRQAKREYYIELNTNILICWLCGKKVSWKEKTIDHIVPRVIINQYELYGLILDKRNFAVAHKKCNNDRRIETIDQLPKAIADKIKALTQ